MSLFDQLVDEALKNRQDLAPLRAVVENELLHHDILRILSHSGLLSQLTFIGGTCLRACYGSNRLSEDLDFTGGENFNRDSLAAMGAVLVESLKAKYGLEVIVSEPTREEGNVDTWKIKVQTRPDRKDMPAQRINIDVCAIPSYQVDGPNSKKTGGSSMQRRAILKTFQNALRGAKHRPQARACI